MNLFRLPAALAAAALLAVPASAAAADAPLRSIDFDAAGGPLAFSKAVGVSADGREVLLTDGGDNVLSRNVAAGTTTVLARDVTFQAASTDLSRVLVVTYESWAPADTDEDADLYLLNRAAGTRTLVTTAAVGSDPNPNLGPVLWGTASLSGNGSVAQFGIVRTTGPEETPTVTQETWRFDATTGAATKVNDREALPVARADDAGRVVVSRGGVTVGSRTWPLPSTNPSTIYETVVSPDGGTVAFSAAPFTSVAVLNTATGAVRSAPVPAWLTTQRFRLVQVENGGASTVLVTRQPRPGGLLRDVFGRLQTTNGALAQIGGDVPVTADTRASASNRDLTFAATGTHLAQLGSVPLPGSEPSTPDSGAKASDYVTFRDSVCSYGPFFTQSWSRPLLTLNAGPRGTDLRAPTKAEATVTKNGAVVNRLTFTPGQSRELLTGPTGGFSYALKVTMTGGGVLEQTVTVAPHAKEACRFPF